MHRILENLVVLPLAPVLAIQGIWVRRRTPLLPEPEGPRRGRVGAGPELRIAIVGDSAAAGVGVSAQGQTIAGRLVAELQGERTVDWRLIARTGATTLSTLARIGRRRLEERDVVISILGVNDVTSGRRTRDWIGDQDRLLDLYRERFGARRIVLCGLPPVHGFPALPQPLRWVLGARARRFDAALRDLAASQADAEHLEVGFGLGREAMAADGFHPGAAVYARWASALADRCRATTRSG